MIKIDFQREHEKNNKEIGFWTALNKVKDIIDESRGIEEIRSK
jgi:hypothetical protein